MNEIQEYNGVEAALSEIKSKYAGRVYDVSTATGLKDARVARREVREVRTGLEKLRKEIKAPAWARCKAIDDEAKRITQELLKIEEPIDTLISAEEERVQREKEEAARKEALRVGMIRERIELFNVMPPWGSSAAQISARLREVNEIPVDATFEEFAEAAAIAKAQAITRLSTLAEEARAIEAEQAKLKALAEEQAAKMAAERKESEERLARERAEHEARLSDERAKAEQERQERIEAQKKLDEAAAAERDRLSKEAQVARLAQAAEWDAKIAAEKAQAIAEAKRDTAELVLVDVMSVVQEWEDDKIDANDAMAKIVFIRNANA